MKKSNSSNSRVIAARAVQQVIEQGRSLSQVLPESLQKSDESQRALVHEMTAGSLRWWWQITAIANQFLKKPLKTKDFDVYCLLVIGIYQIKYTRIPEHAAVSETVNAAIILKKPWAKNLLNAVLRNYLRKKEDDSLILKEPVNHYSYPKWFIDSIKKDWPDHWPQVLNAGNIPPVLTLRVNQQVATRDQVIKELNTAGITANKTSFSPVGLNIEPGGDTKVWQTKAWKQGHISVQDESAQLVGLAVELKPGFKVLDACAAPGGKTSHLLECEPSIELLALDNQALRISRINENLERLKLIATTKVADASQTDDWWDGVPFDLIVLDAPCSGAGVISKHPDIKHLRRPSDIEQNVKTQRQLLDKLWPLLNVGGHLLYCTCSVLRQENDHQARWLLENKLNAKSVPLPSQYGLDVEYGRQRLPGVLPGVNESDGFYYACFEKYPS